MVVKVKEEIGKTKHVKNNDKSKKSILRGERKVSYLDKILSNKNKSFVYNLIKFCNLYMLKVCRHY